MTAELQNLFSQVSDEMRGPLLHGSQGSHTCCASWAAVWASWAATLVSRCWAASVSSVCTLLVSSGMSWWRSF